MTDEKLQKNYIFTEDCITFADPPPIVGWWVLGAGGRHLAVCEKPNIIRRFFMKVLLGIKWVDCDE